MPEKLELYEVKRINLFDSTAEIDETEEDILLENVARRVRYRSYLAHQNLMSELRKMVEMAISS